MKNPKVIDYWFELLRIVGFCFGRKIYLPGIEFVGLQKKQGEDLPTDYFFLN